MFWNWQPILPQRLRSSINASTYSTVDRIDSLEESMKALDDTRLRRLGRSLSYRARAGEPTDELLIETFAATREAGRRTLGMRHYDVQLLAGIALVHGSIVEMQTGEGKTLVATLPLMLYALAGRGAHLATVNDYLAKRDAEWMQPIFKALGLSVGIVESEMDFKARRNAYAKDVTYGTAKEFGFDFLKDRLMQRELKEGRINLGATLMGEARSGDSKLLQRPYWFVLVDEADNVLIDEARTPLIISSPDGEMGEREQRKAALFHFACKLADTMVEDVHYEYDPQKRSAELLGVGRSNIRASTRPRLVDSVSMLELYDSVELALRGKIAFIRDRHYVVRDKKDEPGQEIVIIDEFTGRIAEGRSWRDGLHQAVEAKEGLEVKTGRGGHAARITIQDLFARWPNLAGMTGTIATSAGEIGRTYDVGIAIVPTNRPAIRQRLKPKVCKSYDEKLLEIVRDIKDVHITGRPILVGTRSIDKSEDLSKILTSEGLTHTVLNARNVASEAEIVAAAGGRNQITVSTNMAGRGTDIKLGDGVEELGGLHVICTELHDSARIDRQLVGRCGRQGDPGTWRQFLAVDDDILVEGYGPKRAKRIGRRLQRQIKGNPERLLAFFQRAQQRVEARHRRQRRALEYMERQKAESHIQMSQDPYLDAAS
jgi:preprotein translocase subunit SecA